MAKKVTLVVDGWKFYLNGFEVRVHHDYDYVDFEILKDGYEVKRIPTNIEDVVKYCLEN